MVGAIDQISQAHVARCLACGLAGPERADGLQAKLAFDELFVEAVR